MGVEVISREGSKLRVVQRQKGCPRLTLNMYALPANDSIHCNCKFWQNLAFTVLPLPLTFLPEPVINSMGHRIHRS